MRPYVLSVTLFLLGLASTPATVAALAPSKPSQLVTVAAEGSCTALGLTTDRFDTLVKDDGTTAPFSIPAGQVLVITDLTVFAPGKTAGGTVQVQVVVGTAATSHFAIVTANVTANASGGVGFAATFPTGIVVKSGASICPVAFDGTSNVAAGGSLHGFLTKDK